MSLIETIKADSLQARKDRDTARATLLTTLYSEAAMVGKNAGRDTTDDEVVAIIKKFVKGVDEVLKFVGEGDTTAAVHEKELLLSYLPKQLTDEQVREAIIATGETPDVKNTGKILKALTEKYPGQVDGAAVSRAIKSFATV